MLKVLDRWVQRTPKSVVLRGKYVDAIMDVRGYEMKEEVDADEPGITNAKMHEDYFSFPGRLVR